MKAQRKTEKVYNYVRMQLVFSVGAVCFVYVTLNCCALKVDFDGHRTPGTILSNTKFVSVKAFWSIFPNLFFKTP